MGIRARVGSELMALWDRINPATVPRPSADGTEGYWTSPSAINHVPVYTSETGPRDRQVIVGINFFDGATALDQLADVDTVEAGTVNQCLAMAFNAWRDLWRLLYLLGIDSDLADGGDLDGPDAINFQDLIWFDGSGNGTSVAITWDAESNNPASMLGTRELAVSLTPGMAVVSNSRIAQITAINYTGEFAATLTLDRPLNIDVAGGLEVILTNAHWSMPAPTQRPAVADLRFPLQCRHAVAYHGGAFSSWATHNGAPNGAGVNGGWFCGRMNLGPDLSLFAADAAKPCNNTLCPQYRAIDWRGQLPNSNDVGDFWIGRGQYGYQPVAGLPYFRTGRTRPGLLSLLGLPFVDRSQEFGLLQSAILFKGWGILQDYIGIDDATGFGIWRNFEQHQAARRAASQLESDDVGLFANLIAAASPDKLNGLGAAIGSTDPGQHYELGCRMRRSLSVAPRGLSSPAGTAWISQRPIARRYTSGVFDPAVPGTIYDDQNETELRVDGAGEVTWRIPRMCESVREGGQHPSPVKTSAPAADWSIADGKLTVEFELGVDYAYRVVDPGGGSPPVQTEEMYRAGGDVVRPPVSWESTNPASRRRIGDRQSGLCPGDAIRFTSGDLEGIVLVCSAAEAFGGGIEDAVESPHAEAQGIPDALRANHDKRDIAEFEIPDHLVSLFTAALAGETFPEFELGSFAISKAAPALRRVDAGGNVTTITEFEYDPGRGEFVFDASGLTGLHQLHCLVDVFDVRPLLAQDNFEAMARAIPTIIGDAWFESALGAAAIARAVMVVTVENPPDPPNELRGDTLEGIPIYIAANNALTIGGGDVVDEHIELSAPSVAVSRVGVQWDITGLDPMGGTLWYDWQLAARVSIPTTITRLAADWIAEARVNVRISRAEVVKYESVWEDGDYVSQSGTAESNPPLAIAIVVGPEDITGAEIADFAPLGVTLAAPSKLVGDWVQATVDCTAVLKALLNRLPIADGNAIYALVTTTGATGTESGALDIARQYIETMDVQRDGGGTVTRIEIVSRAIEMATNSEVQLGRMMIRLNQAAIDAGAAAYHHDATGQAWAPDLLAE